MARAMEHKDPQKPLATSGPTTSTSPQFLDIPLELLPLTTSPPPNWIPLELYLQIADYLPVGTLSRLSRTCHSLHTLLAPRLSALLREDSDKVIAWAIEDNHPTTLKHALIISGTTFEGRLMPAGFYKVVFHRHSEIVRILLDHGANPNLTRGHYEPLISAVRGRDITIATMLLEAGAEVSVMEPPSTRTPLEIAQQLGDTAMINLLVKFGARRTVARADHRRRRKGRGR